MTPSQLWQAFAQTQPNLGDSYEAGAFGVEADKLANLVLKGVKTATSSAYDLYALDDEDLPQVGTYDIILNQAEEAVCIVQITKVDIIPFKLVSAEHAFKEGEGDRSLAYWRQVHESLFTKWLAYADLTFTEDSKVVLEEFQVVYPK